MPRKYFDCVSTASSLAQHQASSDNIVDTAMSGSPGETQAGGDDTGLCGGGTPITFPDNDDPWNLKSVLSLDNSRLGGPSSLVILTRIMEYVKEFEEMKGSIRGSAYSPHFDSLPMDQRCLPCHYFDFVGGTGTGGLIATLLGRCKMTAVEALCRFQMIHRVVFEDPYYHLPQYGHSEATVNLRRQAMQFQIEDLTSQCSQPSPIETSTRLKSAYESCTTLFCAVRGESEESQSPCLLKSSVPVGGYTDGPGQSIASLTTRPICSEIWGFLYPLSKDSCLDWYSRSIRNYRSFGVCDFAALNHPSWAILQELNYELKDCDNLIDILINIGGGNGASPRKSKPHHVDPARDDPLAELQHVDRCVSCESYEQGFPYTRFDIESNSTDPHYSWDATSLPVEDLNFADLNKRTQTYLNQAHVLFRCKEVGRRLVEKRILRSKDIQWEHFVDGITYKCPVNDCSEQEIIFLHQNALMDHLRTAHHTPSPDMKYYEEVNKLLDQGRITRG